MPEGHVQGHEYRGIAARQWRFNVGDRNKTVMTEAFAESYHGMCMKPAAAVFVLLMLAAPSAFAAANKEDPKNDAKLEAPPIPTPGGGWLKSRGSTISALRSFCTQRGLAIAEYGDGAVRVALVGGFPIKDPQKEIIEPALLCLEGLELWTGNQQQFLKKPMPDDEVYHLCFVADDGDISAFIDYLRPGMDNTLSKALHSVCALRCSIVSKNALPLLRWQAAYAASTLAMDAFFLERGARPPPWLREGMAAELQRRVCQNEVRVYTIDYELSDVNNMTGDWSKAIAAMIGQRDKMLRPASEVMLMDVIKLPGKYYQQMWSLAAYVVNQSAAKKGPQNKLMWLFCDIINGKSSAQAVKTVYGKDGTDLTKAWQKWALQAK
jgi:hypothetical protein